MRTYILLIIAVLLSTAMGFAYSQPAPGAPAPPPPPPAPGNTMGGMGMGGMMGGMQCPMCGTKPGGQMNPQQMLPMIAQELELTDAQLRQLTNIFLEFAKTHVQNTSRIQTAQIDIGQALLADNLDEGRLEKDVREIGRVQTENMVTGVRALVSAQKVLTPDQWHKLQSMVIRHGLMFMGGMGPTAPGAPPAMGRPMPQPRNKPAPRPQKP